MAIGERLYLVHLRSGDTVAAQFNPEELHEALEVVWHNVELDGESHEPMEYGHTKNLKTSFELGFDGESGPWISFGGSLKPSGQQGDFHAFSRLSQRDDVNLARRFLLACCYPAERNAQNIREAAPSKILVVWPGFYSLAMKLTKVDFTHRQWFKPNDAPVDFSAKLEFEADHDRRLYYEDVLAYGTELHDGSGNPTFTDRGETFG